MTKEECIKNKDWKQLAKLQAEEVRVRKAIEQSKKNHEYYVYAVNKASRNKVIH